MTAHDPLSRPPRARASLATPRGKGTRSTRSAAATSRADAAAEAKRVATEGPSLDVALQGGGSHGAFTWGVLDALLEDGRFRLDGVSGTSAGAMNAAVLATGFARGGALGARQALSAFWQAVSGVPACFGRVGQATANANADSGPPPLDLPSWIYNRSSWPGMAAWNAWLRLWSPYQLNPFNLDPLRDIVQAHVDVAALREGPIKVFVTATSVRTGQPRVFSGQDLSVEALMASACLPQSAQTVVIDGEPFWDGGFSGNPALWPLVYGTHTDDVLLVQINPREHAGIPRTATEIDDRINEITFNASLVAELRAISFVQRLLRDRRIDPTRYKQMRLHRVADEDGLAPFGASSKLNTDPRLLTTLFGLGRHAAQRWLATCGPSVGTASTLDIDEVFLANRVTQAKPPSTA
ncbi:patatin-like phospholipase family protein [Roseateles amylovorans]|uniref:Patatin-like phospholipase family protein n=1 Tax=Roseateles amylovorans TaxID=2978473 RepID=A0ABY6AUD5_9BURK|nr:patatin-like phospholipase family protein [Roseateles amylovorans]UXH76831.1 patatin-like phospholipase family protein [Roseateles amylovorans]